MYTIEVIQATSKQIDLKEVRESRAMEPILRASVLPTAILSGPRSKSFLGKTPAKLNDWFRRWADFQMEQKCASLTTS